jgi:hypothetical protein
MEDLRYILGIGFSGADILRAVVIAFFLAMLFGRKRSAWVLALFALLFDRLVWPMAGMAISGSGIQSIYGSIGALASTFVDDLGLYTVRYFGLAILIAAFCGLRMRVHALAPSGPKKAPA